MAGYGMRDVGYEMRDPGICFRSNFYFFSEVGTFSLSGRVRITT